MGALEVVVSLIARDLSSAGFGSFTNSIRGAGQLLRSLGDDSGFTGAQIATLGGALAAGGVGLAVFGGALSYTMQQAGDLEMAVTRLGLASQSNARDFGVLQQAVVDLATHSLYSTTEAAGAFEHLSEMGFTTQQVMYGFAPAAAALMDGSFHSAEALNGLGRQAMAVGEAMQVNAVDGAQLLGSALNTFKNEGMSAKQAANDLVGAFYNGIPSASDLGNAIQMAGGMASSSGVKFKDFVTTLALLSQAGMSGSAAGASLRYMLQSLDAPTAKQAKAYADLGITTVATGSKMDQFTAQLIANGGATSQQIQLWDGSVTGLQKMYAAAQGVGMIPLDESFNQWALGAGLMKSKLFDAQGGFVGMKGAVEILDKAMADKSLTMQQKMDIISNLFNVRSGRAAQILTNLNQFDGQYQGIWNRIGNTDALGNANKIMGTLQGSIHVLQTTFSSFAASIGQQLIPVFTGLAQWANMLVGAINNIPGPVKLAVAVFLLVGTVLSGLVIAATAAIIAFAIMGTVFGTAFGLILVGIVAVSAVVAGVIVVITHWSQVTQALGGVLRQVGSFLGPLGGLLQALGQSLQAVGTTIMGQLRSAWQTLQSQLQSLAPLLPQLRQLWDAIRPVLIVLGAIIVGVVVVALILLVNAIRIALLAIGPLLGGVIGILAGVAQAVMGFVQLIVGVFMVFVGLVKGIFTGDWTTLLQGLGMLRNGAINLVSGLASAIASLFRGMAGAIAAVIGGLIGTLLGLFGRLAGGVGASVGQLISNVGSLFASLPGRILGALNPMPGMAAGPFNAMGGTIRGILGNIAGTMFASGQHLVQNLINGIMSMIGGVANAVGNIAGTIGRFLGHSVPSEGPLADELSWMPHMMSNLTTGIERGVPGVKSATNKVAAALVPNASGLAFSGSAAAQLAAASAASGYGNGSQTINLNVDGKLVGQVVLDRATGTLKQNGMSRVFR